MDIEQMQREEVRWRILRALDAGRPLGCSSELLWRLVTDIGMAFTQRDITRELHYLESLNLMTQGVPRQSRGTDTLCKLTATGIQVCEYTVECPPGIARPPRG